MYKNLKSFPAAFRSLAFIGVLARVLLQMDSLVEGFARDVLLREGGGSRQVVWVEWIHFVSVLRQSLLCLTLVFAEDDIVALPTPFWKG